MADSLKAGDKVEWDSSQGKIKGTVKKKLTSPMKIKTHKVAASPENPEYLVKSDKTGAEAAHKPGELKKASGDKPAAKKPAAEKTAAKKPPAKKPASRKPAAKKTAAHK